MHILCVHLMPLEKLYSFSCSSHFTRTLNLGIRLHHRLVSSSEGRVEEVEIWLPCCPVFSMSSLQDYQGHSGSRPPEQNQTSPFISNFNSAWVCALKGQIAKGFASWEEIVTEKPGGWGALPESLETRTHSPPSTHHLDPSRRDLAGCQSDPAIPPQCYKASAT